eukprot:5032697-Pleurochrysis_carterae.AAC.1
MRSRGWFDVFSHLPYLPIRTICHGATPRKFAPDRWRSTTDAGAPRKHLTDSPSPPSMIFPHGSRIRPNKSPPRATLPMILPC